MNARNVIRNRRKHKKIYKVNCLENNKFISECTLDFVSLHDCIINSVLNEDKNLIMVLDHIDVLRDHPLNNTGKAMQTGKALIKFVDFAVQESIIYDTLMIQGKAKINVEEDAQKEVLPFMELLTDFEVLQVEKLASDNNLIKYRFDGTTSLDFNAEFGYIIIDCKSIFLEWNDSLGNAWFEW